jgi:hypothetical protein
MSSHDYAPIVARLRDLARTAADSGKHQKAPANPDAELLELCSLVMDLRAEHDSIDREARKMPRAFMTNPAFAAEMKKKDALVAKWRSPLARVSKFEAKTAAGVYAKAHILRMSLGCAPRLAQSLADDLVNCEGLRAQLWPTEDVQ